MSAPTAKSRAAVSDARRAETRRAETRRAEQLGAELRRTGQRRENRRRAALLASVPSAAAGLVAFGVIWAVSWLVLGVVMGIVVADVVGILLVTRASRLTLRLLRAIPAGEEAQPRVHNLLEGLCASAGVAKPAVWVLDSEVPNALVVASHRDRSCLVVTTGLVGRLSRVEMEGALAREVGKLRSGAAIPATVAVATGWPLVLPRRTRAVQAAAAQASADLAAVALTCYPRGLAAVFEGLTDEMPVTGLVARLTGHLWLVSPGAPAGPRAAALREL